MQGNIFYCYMHLYYKYWSFIDLLLNFFVFNSIKIIGLKVYMQILFITIYIFIDLLLIKWLKNFDLFKNIKCLGGLINRYFIYNRIIIDQYIFLYVSY